MSSPNPVPPSSPEKAPLKISEGVYYIRSETELREVLTVATNWTTELYDSYVIHRRGTAPYILQITHGCVRTYTIEDYRMRVNSDYQLAKEAREALYRVLPVPGITMRD